MSYTHTYKSQYIYIHTQVAASKCTQKHFISKKYKVVHSFKLHLLQNARGAYKSLPRPGRKQATATKLGIIQHTPHEVQYTS